MDAIWWLISFVTLLNKTNKQARKTKQNKQINRMTNSYNDVKEGERYHIKSVQMK